MFQYNVIQKGIMHDFYGMPCQDALETFSYQDVICTALSDGVSACRLGGEVAKMLSSRAAIQFAQFFADYCQMTDDELRAEVVALIRDVQRRLAIDYAEKGEAVSLADMGATLALVVYNKRTEEYIALNLGDGAVLARREGCEAAETLLPPVKINMGGALLPVVTVYDAALIHRHISIHHGKGVHDAFLLSSDGMDGVLFSGETGEVSPSVGYLMRNLVEDPQGVRDFLPGEIARLQLNDDASVAMLVHSSPVPETFIDRSKASIPGKEKRRARQCAVYGEERCKGKDRKFAGRKAGISLKDKHEWHNLQARLKRVGFDD